MPYTSAPVEVPPWLRFLADSDSDSNSQGCEAGYGSHGAHKEPIAGPAAADAPQFEFSKSPWAAPAFIVYRNGKPHMVIDYRKLNEVAISDEFHTFQWITPVVDRPTNLTKPHRQPANQRRPLRGT
jgi:hypothetical protein